MQVPYLTPAKVGEEDVLDADGQEERKVFDLLETLELEKKCLSMNEKKLQERNAKALGLSQLSWCREINTRAGEEEMMMPKRRQRHGMTGKMTILEVQGIRSSLPVGTMQQQTAFGPSCIV
ncbi:hypothetical protein C3L33_03801, partial [Rhododendron williamsianum]